MRSPFERVSVAIVAAAVISMSASAAAPHVEPSAAAARPTAAQVDAALAELNNDPNLGSRKKTRELQWKSSSDKPDTPGSALEWIAQAFRWFANTARALLWVSGIVIVGIVALYIKRLLEIRAGERARPLELMMPTHVRDLDIRPSSLPEDIGASALDWWTRGEHRAALSLLYRGMLSRLVHVHAVPIQDSSTEGDCLRLARSLLQTAQTAYVARLIGVWQRAVYGNRDPTDEEIRSLCTEFDLAIGKPALAAVEQAA